MKGGKVERPLFLDMDFSEALARYAQTKPEEVEPAPGQRRKAAKEPKRPGGPKHEPSAD